MNDAIEIAVRLHDRACEYRGQGKYRQAARPAAGLSGCSKANAGAAHPDVANVLNTLGKIQEDLGDYPAAEQSFRRSVSIMEAVQPEGTDIRRLYIQSWAALAGILRVQGRYPEAEPIFRKALSSAEMWFGPDDPEVWGVLNDLAVLYKYTGEFARAEELYRRALRIAEKAYGPEHPDVASIYHNLGGLEHARGRYGAGNLTRGGPWRFGRKRWARTIPMSRRTSRR